MNDFLVHYQEGKVKKWLKAEGEEFFPGDNICEMAFSSLSIAFESEHHGILAKILVHDGQVTEVESPIAVFAANKEDYALYLEQKQADAFEAHKLAEMEEALLIQKKLAQQREQQQQPQQSAASSPQLQQQAAAVKVDKMTLMRAVKHLIQEGQIEDGSGT
jgi:pyruvate dehydrogenase E1 component beta subunit